MLHAEVGASRSWQILSLVGIALAFLQPFHLLGFPDHFSDMGLGVWLVLLAAVCIVRKGQIVVNALLWWWLALGAVLLLSGVVVKLPFDTVYYSYWMYWVVGLAVIQLAGHSSWQEKSEWFSETLAWGLFLMSLASVALALVKGYGLWGGVADYFFESGGRLSGLMNQANVFAVMGVTGFYGLAWLVAERRFSGFWLLLLVPIYGYALFLSGTRVIYLIYGSVLFVVLVRAIYCRDFAFFKVLALSGLAFLIIRSIFPWLDQQLTVFLQAHGYRAWAGGDEGLMDRLSSGFVGDVRFSEWHLALDILRDTFPWGVGAGGYPAASYEQHLQRGLLPMPGLWLHSHNSYLQILLEFGLAGAIWLLGFGCVLATVVWRAISTGRLLQASVLISLLVYSFFEFPFWYMQFFALGLLVASAGVPSRTVFGGRVLGGAAGVLAVLFVVHYSMLFYGPMVSYFRSFKVSAGGYSEAAEQNTDFVNGLIRDPLLQSFGLNYYFLQFNSDPNILEHETHELERMMRYRPYPFVGIKYAIHLAAMGRRDEALQVRDTLLKVSPLALNGFRILVERERVAQPRWEIDFLLEGLPKQMDDVDAVGAAK